MQPNLHLNPMAIVAALIASFVIGSIWYGPLFGRAWAKAMGFPADRKPSGGELGRGIALNLVGTFLMAFVLAHDVAVWRASSWGLGPDSPPAVYGFFGGFFIWLGYIVPMLLNGVAFEKKSWTVFGIGAGYQFLSFQAMGMILAFWR
jgi:hypothetical protein